MSSLLSTYQCSQVDITSSTTSTVPQRWCVVCTGSTPGSVSSLLYTYQCSQVCITSSTTSTAPQRWCMVCTGSIPGSVSSLLSTYQCSQVFLPKPQFGQWCWMHLNAIVALGYKRVGTTEKEVVFKISWGLNPWTLFLFVKSWNHNWICFVFLVSYLSVFLFLQVVSCCSPQWTSPGRWSSCTGRGTLASPRHSSEGPPAAVAPRPRRTPSARLKYRRTSTRTWRKMEGDEDEGDSRDLSDAISHSSNRSNAQTEINSEAAHDGKSKRRFSANTSPPTTTAENPSSAAAGQTKPPAVRELQARDLKAVKVLGVTASVYFIAWGPYVVLVVLLSFFPHIPVPGQIRFAFMWLANSNSLHERLHLLAHVQRIQAQRRRSTAHSVGASAKLLWDPDANG